VALVAALAASCVWGAQAWAADDYTTLDKAVQCLESSRVCALDGTVLEASDQAVADALPNGLSLVVLSPDSVVTYSAGQLAERIASDAGRAVLVMVDNPAGRKDRFGLAGSPEPGSELAGEDQDAFLAVLNRADTNDGSTAIIDSAAELQSIFEGAEPGQAESGGAAPEPERRSPVKTFFIVVGLVIFAVVGGLVLMVVLILRHSSPKRKARSRVDKKLFDNSEHADSVEKALLKLRELGDVYAAKPSRYRIRGVPIHALLNSVIADVQELFRRLHAHGSAQQVRLAEAKYADVLKKLVLAVNRDYYQDIVDNPRLWPQAEARIAAIGAALEAVHQQVLENIKQVNASKDLEFQVALDSLLESERGAKLSDAYGGGPGAPGGNRD
jgi:hypothetical protein